MKYKVIFCVLLPLLLWSQTMTAQEQNTKPKRIYITLDVSVSMRGHRYNMANFTAQTISVFSNSDDQLAVYYLGKRYELENEGGYKNLHKSFDSMDLNQQKKYPEIKALMQFMEDYKPNPKYQDWLFIIGDGVWEWAKSDYEKTTKRFSDFIDKNEIQVCYLQTGDSITDNNQFTQFIQSLSSPKVDVQRSDKTAASVLGQCTYFANKILGFSNTNIQIEQESERCVAFSSEFPLTRFLLVYQSNSFSEEDLRIESADFSGNGIPYKLKGNPTTRPLVKKGESFLSGEVWEMFYKQTIPANEKISVCFDQKIDLANVTVYPYVDVVLNVMPNSSETGPLNPVNKDVFEICKKENEVMVVVEATDSQGRKFEPPLMQKMDIKVFVGGEMKKASFRASDTTFVVTLPVVGDSLSYYATVESPGYFSRITETQTVVKSDNCPLAKAPIITLPVQRFGAVPFEDLIGGRGFNGSVEDTLFQQLCRIGVFDLQEVESVDAWHTEKATVSFDGNEIQLVQKPNSKWCECAYPDTLRYVVTLRSSKGIPLGEFLYEGFNIPISVPVDKRCWLMRCKDYLIVGISLLLFIIYLIALLKKKRFKKNAMINPSYYRQTMGRKVLDQQSGTKLRSDTLGAWLNRWFNPFTDEQFSNKWGAPPTGLITFVASPSKEEVLIVRSSFGENMSMAGYKPNKLDNSQEMLHVNGKITVYTDNKRIKEAGYLTYNSGEGDDEGGFRFMVMVLLLASFASEALVVFTLIKSLI